MMSMHMNRNLGRICGALALVAVAAFAIPALATPAGFPISGTLQGGEDATTTPAVRFLLFGQESGGVALYSEDQTLTLERGRFDAWIGAEGGADALLDGQALWLEMVVEGETLSPRLAIAPLPYAHHARRAAEAEHARESDLAALATLAAGLDEDGMAALAESALILDILGRLATIEVQLGSANTSSVDVGERLGELELFAAQTQTRLQNVDDELESANEVLQHFVVDGLNLILEGVNLHVRSGAGPREWDRFALRFEAPPESEDHVGNLIIGYAESEPAVMGTTWRQGTHNLIMGSGHRWNAHGAILSGDQHRIGRDNETMQGSAAIGGRGHQVRGEGAVSVGGVENLITSRNAVTVGGIGNDVTGAEAVAAGGSTNTVEGDAAVAAGGASNRAEAPRSVMVGGSNNRTEADAVEAVIAAGSNQTLTLLRRFLAPSE